MTNKISSASQTVRAFNVGTLGDCSAWDDNLVAACRGSAQFYVRHGQR